MMHTARAKCASCRTSNRVIRFSCPPLSVVVTLTVHQLSAGELSGLSGATASLSWCSLGTTVSSGLLDDGADSTQSDVDQLPFNPENSVFSDGQLPKSRPVGSKSSVQKERYIPQPHWERTPSTHPELHRSTGAMNNQYSPQVLNTTSSSVGEVGSLVSPFFP